MSSAFWLELTKNLAILFTVLGLIGFAGGVFFFMFDYDTHRRVRWVRYLTATITLLFFVAAISLDAYYESHQPKPTACESEQK